MTSQLDAMDCGPACLKMVSDSFHMGISLQRLRELCHIRKDGVSLAGIADAAEKIGFRSLAVKICYDTRDGRPGLIDFPMPCIAHWNQNHFVVIFKVRHDHIWIADPAHGKIRLKKDDFLKSWISDEDKGVVLGLEPIPGFVSDIGADAKPTKGWSQIVKYLGVHKRLLIQFFIGLFVGLGLQSMMPFLSQSLIDTGIQRQNIHFVWVVLIAQLVLFISQASVQFVQGWILLHIGRRINVSMVSDFLMQLMRLPLGYFDSKNIGDLIQRIQDNARVESFLTGNVLTIFFSLVSPLMFIVYIPNL